MRVTIPPSPAHLHTGKLLPYDNSEKYPEIVFWLYGVLFILGTPFLLYKAVTERRLKVTDIDPNEDLQVSIVWVIFGGNCRSFTPSLPLTITVSLSNSLSLFSVSACA